MSPPFLGWFCQRRIAYNLELEEIWVVAIDRNEEFGHLYRVQRGGDFKVLGRHPLKRAQMEDVLSHPDVALK